jgi:hypothetical protein
MPIIENAIPWWRIGLRQKTGDLRRTIAGRIRI